MTMIRMLSEQLFMFLSLSLSLCSVDVVFGAAVGVSLNLSRSPLELATDIKLQMGVRCRRGVVLALGTLAVPTAARDSRQP